ncbi:PREDICTED: putative malate dehydrogenase 1B [Papilio polytes]|uniref:putative malate dehydrogenase 1B n=1 Tax=Papilio polytes TaxID=76194 RepID=UPI00067691FB|nr:PREDICTED: putative malate dehydrogenase 1B [Papilio polytes]
MVNMGVQIIISGESQCESFAKVCAIADYISQNLPNFCYRIIEKSVLEWKTWLCKINLRNKWHHNESPLIWKELLIEGSKPYYIGGASEFLDYCYSYYQFETYVSSERFEGLIDNFNQYKKKVRKDDNIDDQDSKGPAEDQAKNLTVCISGASHPLSMYIISGLLDMPLGNKSMVKIFIYDKDYSQTFLEYVESECSYVGNNYPGKVVKYTNKMGMALASCDLLIIMDYVPFSVDLSIGDWLAMNAHGLKILAPMINASASRNMYIVLPNLGPACYNATLLTKILTSINKKNIVVVTSDLGLEIAPIVAEEAEIEMKDMFCPPVWGFVGINHLVDVKNTIHKYNAFQPYNRYVKVRKSSLCVGVLTPEFRTLEYLLHFNENLWTKLLEAKKKANNEELSINKAISLLKFVQLWLSGPNSDDVLCLGVVCNGSFGLSFDGVFSQPVKFTGGFWQPACDYLVPKDPHMNILYLADMAKKIVNLRKSELPKIDSYIPCACSKRNKIISLEQEDQEKQEKIKTQEDKVQKSIIFTE